MKSGGERASSIGPIGAKNILDLLSHDLGNSAHTLVAKADMMNAGADNEGLASIGKGVEAMHRMVENVRIAYLASIEPFKPTATDLYGVLGSSAEKARRMSGDGRMELDIGFGKGDVSIGADRMLSDMFAELMLNSIQFAAPDRARVSISCNGTAHGHLIAYEDRSTASDLQRIERSASRFLRLAQENDFHGSGTGLMMAGEVIRRHNGLVRFEHRIKRDPRSGLRIMIEIP